MKQGPTGRYAYFRLWRGWILSAVLLLPVSMARGQSLPFNNASFEGEPADATVPVAWLPCEKLTTPDILPGYWGVYQEASEGDTYVGLITRENGSWESIAQRLPKTLRRDECYAFSLDLAYSRTYSGYNKPIKLRIWGGAGKCDKAQLLYESTLINHTAWKTYFVEFRLEQPINYILLEAFHSERTFSHRGNILIDNLMPLRPCPRAARSLPAALPNRAR